MPRPTFPARLLPILLAGSMLAGPALAQSPAPSASARTGGPELTKVADFGHQVTGVTVSKDRRIFVSFPRWTEDSEVSVAELKDGTLTPFPDAEWNAWRNARKDEVSAKDHWVCVQSVVADPQGNVYISYTKNQVIVKSDPDGKVLQTIHGFDHPEALVIRGGVGVFVSAAGAPTIGVLVAIGRR